MIILLLRVVVWVSLVGWWVISIVGCRISFTGWLCIVVMLQFTAWRSFPEDPLVHPKKWLRPDLVPPAPFLQCEPRLTPGGSGVLADPVELMRNSEKRGFPIFIVLGKMRPALRGIHRLTGEMVADVVRRKGVTAGSLDGWGWRELNALPVAWYDGLARILTKVEEIGVWPDGFLDAYIAIIPNADGDATPLGQRPLGVLPVVYRIWASARMIQLEAWFRSWVPDSVFSAGGGRSSVEAWYTTALDSEVLSGMVISDVHGATCMAGFRTPTLSTIPMLGCVLSSLLVLVSHGLVMDVFLRGALLSMMFVVALYLPWYADNLKCVSRDPGVLLHAARFTAGYVRLVGQEPAPGKCVLMSTSRAVRRDMRGWVVTGEGDRWSVKLDVRDLGEHLDTTFREWSATLAKRVRLVIARLVLVFVLPLDFHGRLWVIRTMLIPGALHGVEASFLADAPCVRLCGLVDNLWPVLGQCPVCLMVGLVVIGLFVLFGSGFVCCVGI